MPRSLRQSPSCGDEQVEQGKPVVEMCGEGFGWGVEIRAESDGRREFGVVGSGVSEFGGEGGELGEKVGGEGVGERREGGADGMVEREFEAGQDIGVEPGLVELRPGEGDQVAPLVAQAEHVGKQ